MSDVNEHESDGLRSDVPCVKWPRLHGLTVPWPHSHSVTLCWLDCVYIVCMICVVNPVPSEDPQPVPRLKRDSLSFTASDRTAARRSRRMMIISEQLPQRSTKTSRLLCKQRGRGRGTPSSVSRLSCSSRLVQQLQPADKHHSTIEQGHASSLTVPSLSPVKLSPSLRQRSPTPTRSPG